MSSSTKAKVLVFDIETSPIEAYVFGLKDQNIALNQIKKDWFVMAFAAKWLGDPNSKLLYLDQRSAKPMENDSYLLKAIWSLLDEADIVITQNGKRFDSRRLNARFILNGMNPPSSYSHLDTYQILSKVADFTSDKLDYYTAKLNTKYQKLTHKEFPGMSLWSECLKGNLDAWKCMQKYNIHDVLSTEELYLNTRAWTPINAPKVFNTLDPNLQCGVCGVFGKVQRRGLSVTKKHNVQRLQCLKCGAWSQGKKELR